MHVRTKIGPDLIEQAHRTLEALSQHQPEDLTKTQAVQKLIAPIRAAQSKGYSLAAIGKVLSDCGIPITTGALRAYVSDAGGGTGRKKKHKAKPPAKAAKEVQPPTAKSSPPSATRAPVEPAGKPGGAGTARSVDLGWDPAARSEKTVPSPAGASRSGFYVRPDTKDI